MSFQFRLKPLLRHREFLLRQAQGALGAAVNAQRKLECEIERLQEAIAVQCAQFEAEQCAGIGAARYQYFKAHLSVLEQELRQLSTVLEKAAAEVETRKRAVLERDKAVKTLENIETRDKEIYELALSREEQKRLDYAAVLLSHRNTVDKGGRV